MLKNKVTYVGMDVHLNSISVAWRKPEEAMTRTLTVPNSPQGVARLVSAIASSTVRAVYEASGCGMVLYDQLSTLGWSVDVLAPTHMRKSVRDRKRKSDVEDAKQLLQCLLTHAVAGGELPTVYVPCRQVRYDRELVRRRLQLGEEITRCKSRINSLLCVQGIRRPKEELKTAWSKKHISWLERLSKEPDGIEASAVRQALASHLRQLLFLLEESKALEKQVLELAQRQRYEPRVRAMTALRGVGVLTAMVFLLELGDLHRFSNRRKLASYIGLTPSTFESGEANNRKGHITRMGPARVRKVLNQAAWVYLRYAGVKKQRWYATLSHRVGKKKAVVALMRILGIELWHIGRAA